MEVAAEEVLEASVPSVLLLLLADVDVLCVEWEEDVVGVGVLEVVVLVCFVVGFGVDVVLGGVYVEVGVWCVVFGLLLVDLLSSEPLPMTQDIWKTP